MTAVVGNLRGRSLNLQKRTRRAACVLLAAGLCWSGSAWSLVTYEGASGVYAQIFNNSSSTPRCIRCHSTAVTGADRQGAPSGVDFNTYAEATSGSNESLAVSRVTGGTMPPPGAAPAGGGGALSGTLQTLIQDWEDDGYPRWAAPTVVTNLPSSVGKTSAQLNGTVDPNGANVSDAHFDWGTTAGNVTDNSTSNTAIGSGGNDADTAYNRTITGLTCGTSYDFRAQASNSRGTGTGATRTFATDPCDPPVIRFTNNVVAGASTTVDMSVNGNPDAFSLTLRATDVDGGNLNWSFVTAPANGTADFGGSPTAVTTSGQNRTIDYDPAADYVGPDSFVIRVSDNTAGTALTDQITVNVNITSDPPEIRLTNDSDAGASVTVTMTEDLPNTFNLTLRAFDANGGTLTWSIQNQAANGTASFNGNPTATNTSGQDRVISYAPDQNVNGSPADSFVVRLTDPLNAPDDITVNVNITPVNDQPTAVNDPDLEADTNATTTLDPLANDFDIDGDALSIVAVDSPGSAGGTITINGAGPNNTVSYTPPDDFVGPPPTGFIAETFTYTVSDGALSDTATVTVSPTDSDDDTIVDFLDNCDADPNTDQDNNDADAEGDVCDPDDDNDGMLDVDEAAYPACLDPFVDDADGDCDGDGRNNGDEIAGGFDPTADDVAPVLAVPSNRVVDATGYLTAVNLGAATSDDVLEGSIAAQPRLNVDTGAVDPCITGSRIEPVYAFRPGRYTVFWTARDTSGNCATGTQSVDVRPLASIGVSQTVAEGAPATVTVTLNGTPPQYPVVLSYSFGGSADGADHDAIPGALTIAAGTQTSLVLNTLADGVAEGDETLVVTLLGASNAALGRRNHTLTIVEGNVPPRITAMAVQQGAAAPGGFVVQGGGPVTVTATATAPESGDSHSFDWSGSDNVLAGTPAANSFVFDPAGLAPNQVYTVAVTVSDNAGATAAASALVTVLASAPALTGADTDGDGAADDAEGYQDSDGDGVPEYLDDSALPANLLQTRTGSGATITLLETEPGLGLRLGRTARHALRGGAALLVGDISANGGAGGAAVANATDAGFEHLGGLFDFEITGLAPGESARVVLPLESALRANAGYRKYTPAGGWTAFDLSGGNGVFSAPPSGGICPGPGDPAYTSGLTAFHQCVQLVIADGGPNDADGEGDGTVRDPGSVGVVAIRTASSSSPKGSALQPWWLALLLGGVSLALVAGRRGQAAARR